MVLYLVKLLTQFAMPLGLALVIGLLALLFWRYRRLARILVLVQVGVLVICSMPLVANQLAVWWESGFPPMAVELSPTADAVVILGGATGSAQVPRLVTELTDSSDRVLHGARLFRAGKVPLVIVSAGNLPWLDSGVPEAHGIRDLLVEWGVEGSAVLLDKGSRNTYENALNTRERVAAHGMDRVLLVTSAWHMRRAVATFRTVGIDVIPSPTDFLGSWSSHLNLLDLLPSSGALEVTTVVLKEMLGILYYRWRGWIRVEGKKF